MRKAIRFKVPFEYALPATVGAGLRPARANARLALLVLLFAWCGHAQKAPVKPVDLNTATVEQLQQLPGIGPTRAKAIVQFREKSGPFQRVEDLLAIRGISKARFEKLRPYVTVSPPHR